MNLLEAGKGGEIGYDEESLTRRRVCISRDCGVT